jgi:hypothetical protein
MEYCNGLPGKYHDKVKMGIKNKLNHLIVGKPTRLVTPPLPVPAPNHAAINRFLEDDTEVEEELIVKNLPEIPVANDFCDIEDGLDNEKIVLTMSMMVMADPKMSIDQIQFVTQIAI